MEWNNTLPELTDKGNKIGNWEGGWLNGEWKCPKCKTILGKNLRSQSPLSPQQRHSCFEWDIISVKEKLPFVRVRIGKKIVPARITGRLNDFATVTIDNNVVRDGRAWHDYHFSWNTLVNHLNNGSPLEI